MSTSIDLDAVAAQMKSAQDSGRQIEPFTARVPGFDLTAAYAVARLIHRARVAEGACPLGRKIGFTNPQMWERFGVREPIWAFVYDRTVVRLGGLRTAFRLGRLAEPRIEPEIVLHFARAPRPGDEPAQILACIDWIAHGFEIVQSHFPGWTFQAADTVADGSLHGALLVGPPRPTSEIARDPIEALHAFRLTLFCDGVERERGMGCDVLGSPLAAAAHLVSVLAGQPDSPPLQAGELVTTGTLTTARSVHPGQIWHSALQGIGLPGLAVEFFA